MYTKAEVLTLCKQAKKELGALRRFPLKTKPVQTISIYDFNLPVQVVLFTTQSMSILQVFHPAKAEFNCLNKDVRLSLVQHLRAAFTFNVITL